MLASSPSGTDSHLVIHLKGCFALTVLHFGSDPDKPLNNIVSLANSGPVCRAHLKNMPLIISKRHTIGVSNYKSTGGVVPTPQRQVFLLCFCVSHTVSLSVQLLLLSMQLWTKESKAQAACILWTETLAVSVHSSTQ